MNYPYQKASYGQISTTVCSIIGLGATGSWLAVFLSKFHFLTVYGYDFDIIDERNPYNQYYTKSTIGYKKSTIMNHIIDSAFDLKVKSFNGIEKAKVYVLAVDSMESRLTIMASIENLVEGDLVIDPRAGLNNGRIITYIHGVTRFEDYLATTFSDDSASSCSDEGNPVVSFELASKIVQIILNYLEGVQIPFQIDVIPKYFITNAGTSNT